MNENNDRHLHFIVRHDAYEHCLGYGYFLNSVLKELNKEPPPSARALVDRATMLMLNPETPDKPAAIPTKQKKNGQVFFNCLPRTLTSRLGFNSSSFDPNTENGQANAKKIFGVAVSPSYGLSYKRALKYSEDEYEKSYKEKGMWCRRVKGHGAVTPIVYEDGIGYRGYLDTLIANYGLKAGKNLENFSLDFTYPIPGDNRSRGNEELQGMKIGSTQRLGGEFARRYEGDPNLLDHFYNELYKQENQLIFLHPNCDDAYEKKLIRCIDPLLRQLDEPPASPVAERSQPPRKKLEAMAGIYWLLAQSTPIIHGGSGLANVVLEHMAHRLRSQGYDYEVPYPKPGIDLWAQAATMPLESKFLFKGFRRFKGFKERFTEGVFFDMQAKDQDIEKYLHDHLQSPSTTSWAMDTGRSGARTSTPPL